MNEQHPKPGTIEHTIRRLRMDLTNAQTRLTQILNTLPPELLGAPITEARTNVPTLDPTAALERMIRNGAIHDRDTLEHLLNAEHVAADDADRLRAMLPRA